VCVCVGRGGGGWGGGGMLVPEGLTAGEVSSGGVIVTHPPRPSPSYPSEVMIVLIMVSDNCDICDELNNRSDCKNTYRDDTNFCSYDGFLCGYGNSWPGDNFLRGGKDPLTCYHVRPRSSTMVSESNDYTFRE
jgi:hypothetical protein